MRKDYLADLDCLLANRIQGNISMKLNLNQFLTVKCAILNKCNGIQSLGKC